MKEKEAEKKKGNEEEHEEKKPFIVPFMTEEEVEETRVPNRAHTEM